jgi:hypothetical protein
VAEVEPLDTFDAGGWTVRVMPSCARRDLYELRLGDALPPSLRERLHERGELTGNDVLWVLDVPGRHRVTIARAIGRIVVLPRMEPTRAQQRADVVDLVSWLRAALDGPSAAR